MSLFLKNYTSEVPISETIHRIEKVLIKCGVSGIMKDYGRAIKEICTDLSPWTMAAYEKFKFELVEKTV